MEAVGQQLRFERGIFKPEAAVRALRDARYQHPSNAIAELIDNSWDARASHVEVLIEEKQTTGPGRRRGFVNGIAVVDNGIGMDTATLIQALRVGGRSESPRTQPTGKYGMGLPTASASQCRRVDVWTWVPSETIEHPYHCYLDIGEIESGKMTQVPEADRDPVPPVWRNRVSDGNLSNDHGTLVLWSDIDRITEQPDTLFRWLERNIGRTYRHFIISRDLTIRMAAFHDEQSRPVQRDGGQHADRLIRPNDPLFLMEGNAMTNIWEEPWNNEPMFEPYDTKQIHVTFEGRDELVEVRSAIVKRNVIIHSEGVALPGTRPQGHDARRNIGLSVVREHRELLLDPGIVREGLREDPRNRWWGCEVSFGAGLDNLFGIDHNKQMAVEFSKALRQVFQSDRDDMDAVEEAGVTEEDSVYHLYEIVRYIRNITRSMIGDIDSIFRERRRQLRPGLGEHERHTPEAAAEQMASMALKAQLEAGEGKTSTDRERSEMPEADRVQALTGALEDAGFADARKEASEIVRNDIRFKFVDKPLHGYNMFEIESKGGALIVSLNIHHPLHKFLEWLKEHNEDTARETAHESATAILTLLLAWARLEDQIEDANRKRQVQDTATSWGRQANEVLNQIVEHVEDA